LKSLLARLNLQSVKATSFCSPRVLANYQASERDDRRDAEPGKIMHELRQGDWRISE
jgi:hypothetical protein